MVSEALSLLTSVVSSINDWFIDIFEATSAGYIYLGALAAFLSIRFLVVPIFGQSIDRGSDRARPSKEKEDSSTDLMVI